MSLSSVKLPCSADSHAFLPPPPPPTGEKYEPNISLTSRACPSQLRIYVAQCLLHHRHKHSWASVCPWSVVRAICIRWGMSQHILKQSRSNLHVSREVMSKAAGFSWSYDGNRSIATTARVACLL